MKLQHPHPELIALYVERAAHRNADTGEGSKRRTMAFQIELRIAAAERQHGRTCFLFKRCPTCHRLHPAAAIRCDNRGEHLFHVILRLGSPELILIVD
jgi:cytochrome c2